MFVVFMVSAGGVRHDLAVFEHEIDAADFCDVRDWEWIDDNRFVWRLDYREV